MSSSKSSMRWPAMVFSVAALGLFATAVALPCIDTKFAEMTAGRAIRGYQCFFGVFIAPLANLAATPLWIVLSAGNISVLLLPVCWTRGPLGARVQRAIRLTTVLGLIGALTLWVVGDRIGVTVLHTGATVWTASLFCGTLATWTPRLSGARIAARESSNPA